MATRGEDRPAWTLRSRPPEERLDFSADSRILFVSQRLFTGARDVDSGELRYSVEGHGVHGSLDTAVAFTTDDRLTVTPDHEALRVWETTTGEVITTLPTPETPREFALSADGSFALTREDRLVRVWEAGSGRCLRTLEGHRASIHRVVLIQDGTLLATTDLDSGLGVWELAWEFDFPPEVGDRTARCTGAPLGRRCYRDADAQCAIRTQAHG